ncbi:MAG: transglutaminase-like domain-containing protein [Phycisphaerales bacterium JB063]
MPLHEPLHCRLDAFTALRDQLPELNTTRGLVRSAVAVSMHELDHADIINVEIEIDDYARQVLERVNNPKNARAVVAHTHEVLFEEARFRGNLGDYDNPRNSYLGSVLRTRLGLPITLALLYKAVLDGVGVPCFGINAPGHFLAALPADATSQVVGDDPITFIDPFAGGRLLTRDEALQRVLQTSPHALLDDDPLPVATHKQWLLRIIRNLIAGFDRNEQHSDTAAMLEMTRMIEELA